MSEYRVNLDVYNGPLDLLLYLIRRDEVDIYDIPIARITTQYVEYVGLLKSLDPNLAGEFLVMAATLMEIKTRMLLPSAAPAEGEEEGVEIDPRAELVRQLLEYKAFKDAAGQLRAAHAEQALKFPRGRQADLGEAGEVDLEDVQVWDLLDAFNGLMSAIGADQQHEVIYDDTPVELHATDILDRLQSEGPMTFERIFEGRSLRSELVGLFLALLELIRRGRIFARQDRNFGEIHLHLNPKPPPEDADDEADRAAPSEESSPRLHGQAQAPREGRYVPQSAPSQQDDDDDSGTETGATRD